MTHSMWGSSNYRPSAPFLYGVASHVKNCHSGHYYYYYVATYFGKVEELNNPLHVMSYFSNVERLNDPHHVMPYFGNMLNDPLHVMVFW